MKVATFSKQHWSLILIHSLPILNNVASCCRRTCSVSYIIERQPTCRGNMACSEWIIWPTIKEICWIKQCLHIQNLGTEPLLQNKMDITKKAYQMTFMRMFVCWMLTMRDMQAVAWLSIQLMILRPNLFSTVHFVLFFSEFKEKIISNLSCSVTDEKTGQRAPLRCPKIPYGRKHNS